MASPLLFFFFFFLLLLPKGIPFAATASFPSAVSDLLRTRGYSLSAGVLDAAYHASSTTHRYQYHHHRRHHLRRLLQKWNATGTLFLPSDSAFKPSTTTLPPSTSLFLYHAAHSPPLRFSDLVSLPTNSSLPTFSRRRRCLFLLHTFTTTTTTPCLSTSPSSTSCVKISHPDLFLSPNLVIHGVDGVLDPSAATFCNHSGSTTWRRLHYHSSLLDRAVLALRRKGFHGVAREVHRRRAELAELPAITVFAHRARRLLRQYDLLRHVATGRYRLLDLSSLLRGARITTMDGNSTVRIGGGSGEGDLRVTVDGIAVDGEEIFRNGWAVVLSIKDMLPVSDDVADQVSDEGDYPDLPLIASSEDSELEDGIGGGGGDGGGDGGAGVSSGAAIPATAAEGNSSGATSGPSSQGRIRVVRPPMIR